MPYLVVEGTTRDSRVVRFPTDENARLRWIAAMPNASSNLEDRRDIFVCASHFECEWVTAREGRRPAGPSALFLGVSRSCLKQWKPVPITTKQASNSV